MSDSECDGCGREVTLMGNGYCGHCQDEAPTEPDEHNRHRPLNPTIALMEDDVKSHGEVHAVVEEMDKEAEVRVGTAEFDYNHGVITLDASSHPTERIGMDRVVSWYLPEDTRH